MAGVKVLREVVLATRSSGKITELRGILAEYGIVGVALSELGVKESAEESGLEVFETFEENALAKGMYFARMLPGRAVLAEDSGLAVDALGGAPGVRSKRWSGVELSGELLDEANNEALLAALSGVEDRRARYVCAAVYIYGETKWACRGETLGVILGERVGLGGFGYDPLFLSSELGRSFGEASGEEKGVVSHRGRAIRGLIEKIGVDRRDGGD